MSKVQVNFANSTIIVDALITAEEAFAAHLRGVRVLDLRLMSKKQQRRLDLMFKAEKWARQA